MKTYLTKFFALGIVLVAYTFLFIPAFILQCLFILVGGLFNGAARGLERASSDGFIFGIVHAAERRLWTEKRSDDDD